MDKSHANLGFEPKPWLELAQFIQLSSNDIDVDHILCVGNKLKEMVDFLKQQGCHDWQIQDYEKNFKENKAQRFDSKKGYVWAICLESSEQAKDSNANYISLYAQARDAAGFSLKEIVDLNVQDLRLHFLDALEEQWLGALVGLEMAAYKFTPESCRLEGLPVLSISCKDDLKETLAKAEVIGSSVNIARHLVNLPASHLHPKSYSEFVQSVFAGSASTTVNILEEKQLLEEKMILLKTVGQAAEHSSRLVHISYRPKNTKTKQQPVAFVGKGITFDSGGLDLKPPKGMRFMKKDMGGSAAVVGVAYHVVNAQLDIACDFYLALAENAVSANAFRPGDILKSRKGIQVEIDNTDAEGRLVLADAIDYALTHNPKEKPRALVDVATLTGAMRIAVGTELIGAFCNTGSLWSEVKAAAEQWGDPAWQMPLYDEYEDYLDSSFADVSNAASTSYGGAISAALFLRKFMDSDTPWLHFDMMSYQGKPKGALLQSGGNGQAVQLLSGWLSGLS